MSRKWLETILISVVAAIAYYAPIISTRLPVFYKEFNSVDYSLHAVRLMDVLLSVLIIMIISRYLFPRFDGQQPRTRTVLLMLGLILIGSGVEWLWDHLVLLAFNLPTAPGEVSDKMIDYPVRKNLESSILMGNFMLMTVGIVYGLILDRNQRIRNQEQLKQETLATEVKFLRSQIDPHFLFNTLNNIYAITQRNADQEGSAALLRLSGLMRYMIYDSGTSSTSLEREIEHLKNYRDLMLMKYPQDQAPHVEFNFELDNPDTQIAPLLLLPFMENAFKHGLDSQGQGFVHIRLNAQRGGISFVVENSIQPHIHHSEHKGIGLENIKKRLDLLYPGRHVLTVQNDGQTHAIHLRIDL